jgi:hypothetical protein
MLPHPSIQQMNIANFDSSASMLRATSAYLKRESHANIGVLPEAVAPLAALVGRGINKLPIPLREPVYIYGGGMEAISPRKLHKVDAEQLAEWTVRQYPEGQYPAVMLGSSNGAAVHLCAAMGVPWLPQSYLIPVRRSGIHPDEPWQELSWSKEPARRLLDANPDIELHHMLDPVQDLMMSWVLSYFRIKRLRLGAAYEEFLLRTLEPGGTILLLECQIKWPCTTVSDRHFFQFGAPGGANHHDLFEGSARVEDYLRRYNSYRRRWDPPQPDVEVPEAEWGFAPQLRDDVERFARQHGYRVRRIIFQQPEQLSPLVADLYRWWHQRRGLLANRLVVESFLLVEPYWMMRTGAVPFWLVFPTEPLDTFLESYLSRREPFDEIGMMLFSHGVESVGLVPIERWRRILDMARQRGSFIGVDEEAYPRDFAAMLRYHTDFKEVYKARYPLPPPLSLATFDEFLAERGQEYAVRFEASVSGTGTLH